MHRTPFRNLRNPQVNCWVIFDFFEQLKAWYTGPTKYEVLDLFGWSCVRIITNHQAPGYQPSASFNEALLERPRDKHGESLLPISPIIILLIKRRRERWSLNYPSSIVLLIVPTTGGKLLGSLKFMIPHKSPNAFHDCVVWILFSFVISSR